MERNKIKIICNPYEKTIEYKRWDYCDDMNGFQWKDLGLNSKLITNKEFAKGLIQHNALKIIEELSRVYGHGGLDIVFEGTEEDYHDLKKVVERFGTGKDIKCEQGDYYIDSAKTVMPDIQNIFIDLVNVFDKYKSEDVKKIISQFLNATETIIPICVVGLYSSGKSAFINALIGEEILPSADDPTTARIFKIMESEDMGEISFSVSGEKISMLFEDDKYKISGNIEEELCTKLHDCLEKIELKSVTRNMYYSLKVINDYANDDGKEDKISPLITVAVPFGNSDLKNSEYKFIIFDTPGSDSESHKEHFNVLESALKEQTNGLPILVTTPELMDREGMGKLLETIEEIDGNLDITNVLIVVNQADSKSKETLKKKKEGRANTILMNWKPKGVYFASAIVGLGSKKMDDDGNVAWIDPDYRKQFKNNKEEFVNSDNLEDYKQLYTYNLIADDKQNKYLESVSRKTKKRDLLYINSGLHCIEREIVEFAGKYALYNKCSQAQKYLKEALDCTTEQIKKLEQELKEIKKKTDVEMEENKKKLLGKLEKTISDEMDKFNRGYSVHMKDYVEIMKKKSIEDMQSYIDAMWKAVKENVEWGKRVEGFLTRCKCKSKEIKERRRIQLRIHSEEYCKSKRTELQEMCCDIVKGDENLKDEERDFLQQFIMNLKMPEEEIRLDEISADDIKQRFLFFKFDNINLKKINEIYVEIFRTFFLDSQQKINSQHRDMTKGWAEQLKSGLSAKLCEMNPKLREEAEKIEELRRKIKEMGEHKKDILNKVNEVKEMFVLKEREA